MRLKADCASSYDRQPFCGRLSSVGNSDLHPVVKVTKVNASKHQMKIVFMFGERTYVQGTPSIYHGSFELLIGHITQTADVHRRIRMPLKRLLSGQMCITLSGGLSQ